MSQSSVVEDISNEQVLSYYTSGAAIANKVLKSVIQLCVADATVVSICQAGDKMITDETANLFKKEKTLRKGVAYPTSVAINNMVGNFSPLVEDKTTLKNGDVVKIDLGVHFDGYISVVAHTVVVGTQEVTGRAADVISAAYNAIELAVRLLKTGGDNDSISTAIASVAADFNVAPVAGVLSHNLEKDVIDGKLVITNREEPENKTEKVVFAPLQIFALDVVLSTGDGKPKVSEERTTIFKRNTDRVTSLKVASARTLLSEIDRTVGPMPFTLRRFDPKIAKLGAIECVQKELLQSYPSTIEKKGELVSQFKYTVAIMPNGKTQILTGVPLDLTQIKSTCSVKDEMYQKTIKSTIARKK